VRRWSQLEEQNKNEKLKIEIYISSLNIYIIKASVALMVMEVAADK
jgi:hypothetical protein